MHNPSHYYTDVGKEDTKEKVVSVTFIPQNEDRLVDLTFIFILDIIRKVVRDKVIGFGQSYNILRK